MLADDGVEDGVLGVTGLIRAMGMATPWRSAGRKWRQWPEMDTRCQGWGRARLPMIGHSHFSAAGPWNAGPVWAACSSGVVFLGGECLS